MQIMGILNVTPDSFSDGGLFNSLPQAIEKTTELFRDGAHIIDIGAESTRPGSDPVSPEIEWQRLEPVLEALHKHLDRISLDTRNDETALRALGNGVRFFNNVNGFYKDATMKKLGAQKNVKYCAMHMHGTPGNMQDSPLGKEDALREVEEFFAYALTKLKDYGFDPDNCYLDPGVGFGKSDAANIALIQNSHRFSDCYNLLCGISRKSFMGRLFNIDTPNERDVLSKAFEIALIEQKVQIIRTHNVKMLTEILGKLNGRTF